MPIYGCLHILFIGSFHPNANCHGQFERSTCLISAKQPWCFKGHFWSIRWFLSKCYTHIWWHLSVVLCFVCWNCKMVKISIENRYAWRMWRWTMKDVLTTRRVNRQWNSRRGTEQRKRHLWKTGRGMQWGDAVNSLFREIFFWVWHTLQEAFDCYCLWTAVHMHAHKNRHA